MSDKTLYFTKTGKPSLMVVGIACDKHYVLIDICSGFEYIISDDELRSKGYKREVRDNGVQ